MCMICCSARKLSMKDSVMPFVKNTHTPTKYPHVFCEYICLYRRRHEEKGLNRFAPKYGHTVSWT